MTAALAARRLVKEYGGVRALGPLDLQVEPGELIVLTGHNGAGKSTLLRLAAGLLEPSAGEIAICGEKPGSMGARRTVSFVPDTPVLYEDLGIAELAEYVARMHGQERWQDRIGSLLERLDLADRSDQLPAQLSRGLRQRVALLLGLCRPSALLLLDEPFGPLDGRSAAVVAQLVSQHAAGGSAVVVASHQIDLLPGARSIALRDGVLEKERRRRPAR